MNSSASHFSLLVVDDEPDLRTLYELTLLREGYDVESAGCVEDAWLHLKDRTYSAVITDMRLPDGTGLDLLRRLDEAGRREKAIVITAYGSAENAVEALKAGAYDYLTKPVDLKQFRAVVASALGRTAGTPTVQPGNLPSAYAPAPARVPLDDPADPASGPVDRAASQPPMPPRPTALAATPVASTATPAGRSAQAIAASRPRSALARMVGESQAMLQVRAMVEKVARSMAPVLIHGESGTGKELVARSIHEVSSRAAQPFVAVNCGAIPEQLLEAEFFGYRKGAFTGANEDRDGFFMAARGGTLFLDEIGDLPLSMQSKLLRAIQERAVRPVGAVAEQAVDARILSASHKDLGAEVQAGRFRQDLYYRLNVILIRVPPLRERLDDLPIICTGLLDRIARDAGAGPPARLTPAALARLAAFSFPGNVRELENLLHRAVALTVGNEIDVEDLGPLDDGDATPPGAAAPAVLPAAAVAPAVPRAAAIPAGESAAAPAASSASGASPLPHDLSAHLDQVEREILVRALEHYRYNRTAAGAAMGLSLRQMRYRMNRLGIQVNDLGGGDDADAERDGSTSGD